MKRFERAIIIVMDSVGVGAMPDAHLYGDAGTDTLGGIARVMGGLKMPALQRLGLGNIHSIIGVHPTLNPLASYGKMAEKSAGKDTTTGHWEIAGLITTRPFPVYPHGFPPEVIEPFKKAIGRDILANHPASGTEVIKQYGEEHMGTGKPIVYTSADSVFQVAAHEEVIPVEELYEICLAARMVLVGDHAVSRVIARPFVGNPGNFTRTRNRKDFALPPPEDTLLDLAKAQGFSVSGIGKIEDIFANKGLTFSEHISDNSDGMDKTVQCVLKKKEPGIIFTNLVDFDMVYGHRNDAAGYARALEQMDAKLPPLMEAMEERDILFITADHGCDPTDTSTDHTREYVPLLVYGKALTSGKNLDLRSSFADIAATIQELLGIEGKLAGTSFAWEIVG